MVLLDTNVLSELMRFPLNASVGRWAARQRMPDLFTSAISQAEILAGLEIMPSGKRRDHLVSSAQILFDFEFRDRILAFDTAAARAYAAIVRGRRRLGRPIGTFDAQIAAIAASHKVAVATRNVRDFEACGVAVVNPWDA